MTQTLAVLSLILGAVYTSYGILTIIDLAGGWRRYGLSHFGLAWIAMAFTCGPHHLEHGLHLLMADRTAGWLELLAVAVGFPAGVIWFLLRLEALGGGRGDRVLAGPSRLVLSLPTIGAAYLAVFVVGATTIVWDPEQLPPTIAANGMLVILYSMIGWYLFRTQLETRRWSGNWSLSGVALTAVFPTCALMHAAWIAHQVSGRYETDVHTVLIDWLAVPAAAYFLWVVRGLHTGTVHDWNEATTGAVPDPALA